MILVWAIAFLPSFVQAEPLSLCPFCNGERVRNWTQSAHSDFLRDPHNPFPDAPILSSRHFVAYITKGAFVPHYFLLVSKEHFERIADLPPDHLRDLQELKNFFESYYREFLKTDFIAFEHGALPGCHAGGGKGGCIDHLHLHMLPFANGRLRPLIEREYGDQFAKAIRLKNWSRLTKAQVRTHSYILLQEVTGETLVFPVSGEIPSQLMRKIVASQAGVADQWNWREFVEEGDFLQNSIKTFEELSRFKCETLLKNENSSPAI